MSSDSCHFGVIRNSYPKIITKYSYKSRVLSLISPPLVLYTFDLSIRIRPDIKVVFIAVLSHGSYDVLGSMCNI